MSQQPLRISSMKMSFFVKRKTPTGLFLLIADLAQNVRGNGNGTKDNEDCYHTLEHQIKTLHYIHIIHFSLLTPSAEGRCPG